jgi:hypothetical protein
VAVKGDFVELKSLALARLVVGYVFFLLLSDEVCGESFFC